MISALPAALAGIAWFLFITHTTLSVSSNRPPLSSTFDGVTYNDFVLPFDFSYQLDVWGTSAPHGGV
jgi:hypothetical protein